MAGIFHFSRQFLRTRKTWTRAVTGFTPQARAGMSLSYVNGFLYLFGGSGHTTRCFNDVHVYDPQRNEWAEASPSDTRRNHRL